MIVCSHCTEVRYASKDNPNLCPTCSASDNAIREGKLQTEHLTGILGTLKDISELLREIRDSNADISNHTSEPMSVYVQNHADI